MDALILASVRCASTRRASSSWERARRSISSRLAMAAAAWAERLPRYRTYLVAFLICGAPRFVMLAIDAPLWSVLVVAVAGGCASGFLNPVLGAVLFERIPPELMGRVTSMNLAMSWSLIPFGGLLGGLAVAAWGLSPALLLIGAAYLVTTMAPAVQPRWKEMDQRPEPAERQKSAIAAE